LGEWRPLAFPRTMVSPSLCWHARAATLLPSRAHTEESIKRYREAIRPAYAGTYAAAPIRIDPDRPSNAKDQLVAWRWKSPDMAVKRPIQKSFLPEPMIDAADVSAGLLYLHIAVAGRRHRRLHRRTRWVVPIQDLTKIGLGIPANDGWLHRASPIAPWRLRSHRHAHGIWADDRAGCQTENRADVMVDGRRCPCRGTAASVRPRILTPEFRRRDLRGVIVVCCGREGLVEARPRRRAMCAASMSLHGLSALDFPTVAQEMRARRRLPGRASCRKPAMPTSGRR